MIQTFHTTAIKFKNISFLPFSRGPTKKVLQDEETSDELAKQPSVQEVMKSIIIELESKKAIIGNLMKTEDKRDLHTLQPFSYIFQNGGKRIRTAIAILIAQMYTSEISDEVIQIGSLIELLHTGSLIIDDIEDSSQSRREKPCAHLVFGISKSINAANLMYFLAFKNLLSNTNFSEAQKGELIRVYTDSMVTCHLGQAEDVQVHKTTKIEDLPSMADYIRLTSAKTSSLFSMLIKMLATTIQIDEENTETLTRVMRYVGICFQITDDILNLTENLGKQLIAQDLHERKFTLIVHFLKDNHEFMKCFFEQQKTSETISRMLQILHETDAIEKTRQIAFGYAEKALKQVQKVKCPNKKNSFKAMIRFIVQRNK